MVWYRARRQPLGLHGRGRSVVAKPAHSIMRQLSLHPSSYSFLPPTVAACGRIGLLRIGSFPLRGYVLDGWEGTAADATYRIIGR